MIAGIVIFFIGLGLYIAKLDFSLGSLTASTIALMVMALGAIIAIVDGFQRRSRKIRTTSRVARDDQGNAVRQTDQDVL